MKWLILLASFQVQVWACEPAKLQFEGTALTEQPLQLEGDKIYFFRRTPFEVALEYHGGEKNWCFESPRALGKRSRAGCLERVNGKTTPVFVLRDLKSHPVGSVSVSKNLLTLNFVDKAGKLTGKRLAFKKSENVLEVRGWNCPNSQYLSCVGSDLKTSLTEEGSTAPLPIADLAQRLGHYRMSCTGLFNSPVEEPNRH